MAKRVGGAFDGFEVISSYTDAEAVDDGVLVSVSAKDRVTRAVFEFLCELNARLPEEYSREQRDSMAVERARDFIGLYGAKARKIYKENIGGGIFRFTFDCKVLWIIPNELGGLTLMFPEDY